MIQRDGRDLPGSVPGMRCVTGWCSGAGSGAARGGGCGAGAVAGGDRVSAGIPAQRALSLAASCNPVPQPRPTPSAAVARGAAEAMRRAWPAAWMTRPSPTSPRHPLPRRRIHDQNQIRTPRHGCTPQPRHRASACTARSNSPPPARNRVCRNSRCPSNAGGASTFG
jgi:hypothetical protein